MINQELVNKINKNKDINVSFSVDSDGYIDLTIRYKDVNYINANHYIDAYHVDKTVEEIQKAIIAGYEYEKEKSIELQTSLSNENRF